MTESMNTSPFTSSVIKLAFMYSTIFTLAYLYFGAQAIGPNGLLNPSNDQSFGTTLLGVLAGVGDLISWASPWAAVKLLISYITTGTPLLYLVVNMLLLQPIGWIIVYFEALFILEHIPTVSSS